MKKLNISPYIGFYFVGILVCLSTWWVEHQSIPLESIGLIGSGYATMYLYGIVLTIIGFCFSTMNQIAELRRRIEEGNESEDRP